MWTLALCGYHHARLLLWLLGHHGSLHWWALGYLRWCHRLLRLSCRHTSLWVSGPLPWSHGLHGLHDLWTPRPHYLHWWRLHGAWHALRLVVYRKAIHGHAVVLVLLSVCHHLYVPCHFDSSQWRMLLLRLLLLLRWLGLLWLWGWLGKWRLLLV